jgi:hypothetical protein
VKEKGRNNGFHRCPDRHPTEVKGKDMRPISLKVRTACIALTVLSGTGIAIGAAGTAFANSTSTQAGCSSTYYRDAYLDVPLETVTWSQQDVTNRDLGDSSVAPQSQNQISSTETHCDINVVYGNFPEHPDFVHPYAWHSAYTASNYRGNCSQGGAVTEGGVWEAKNGSTHHWRTVMTRNDMGELCNGKANSFSIHIDVNHK